MCLWFHGCADLRSCMESQRSKKISRKKKQQKKEHQISVHHEGFASCCSEHVSSTIQVSVTESAAVSRVDVECGVLGCLLHARHCAKVQMCINTF